MCDCQSCQVIQRQILEEENQLYQNQFRPTMKVPQPYKSPPNQQQIPANKQNQNLRQIKQKPIKTKKTQQQTNQCCSKHKKCLSKQKDKRKQQKKAEISIEFPKQLLSEQEPVLIDVHPTLNPVNQANIQQLMLKNIKLKKLEALQKKLQKERVNQLKQQRLNKLASEIREKLSQNKKKDITKDRAPFGHSIFNDHQRPKQQLKQQHSKSKKRPIKDPQLKPIYQRIKDYKSKQKQEKKKNGSKICCVKNVKPEEIQENNNKIIQRSKKLLKQMKREQQEKRENKKIIQAKIRALQIQSLENVNKCKKKKVPENGDFVFDPIQTEEKFNKQKKANKNNEARLPKTERQLEKQRNIMKKSRHLSKNKIDKANTQAQQINNQEKQQIGKFYFWQIPILPKDYEQVLYEKNIRKAMDISELEQPQSFRNEVNNYLADKFRAKMQDQLKVDKQKKFEQLVNTKKLQLMKEFQQNDTFLKMGEAFWNQDQIFRPQILQNFENYPYKQNSYDSDF